MFFGGDDLFVNFFSGGGGGGGGFGGFGLLRMFYFGG